MADTQKESTIGALKKIITISFPLVVQGLVFQLQSLTDKAFLGNLDTRFVSAAGAAQMPFVALEDSLVAVSIGITIIISNLYGARREKEIPTYIASSCLFHSFIGIGAFLMWQIGAQPILVFFQVDPQIIGYSIQYVKICSVYLIFIGFDSVLQSMLQGMGETKPIMYAGILKVGLNVILSWILIFGKFGFPQLQVAGAAIGTLAANVCSFSFIACYCLVINGKKYALCTDMKKWVAIRPYVQAIKLGMPVGLEYLLWNASNLLLIRFINGFSYLHMAIFTLTFGFQCVVSMIYQGTSKAALTMIGQNVGAGNRRNANRFFYVTVALNFAVVAAAAAGFFLIPGSLLRIFSNDPAVITQGIPYLQWIGIIMFSQSVNIICGSAIRANGNTKWMLCSQLFGSILITGFAWLCVERFHFGMLSIYVTIFLDETIRGAVNFVYYRKKYGGTARSAATCA
ncbi:MATE family efflux transporter [Treponema brennaborense]|uniref:Multidrug-efflux transporter n=1 Tax=Treponema brennaborense (strain DSM 12168 / CIP 105900 / DD5/3) TaxID=906968 RepID=F4LM23_TREBD|nr:MATE family efflux transporter [Treponema brennaborense]AEE16702.1 MATE efflux family protein [Treponema brennaborense DSM 12168]